MKKSTHLTIFQHSILIGIFLLPSLNVLAQVEPQEKELSEIKWTEGPCIAKMEDIAEIYVPGGHIFCDGNDTRKVMESLGNPPTHEEMGFLADVNSDWFIVFEFSNIGYVKDDEKDSLDIDAMLQSIQKGTEESNKYRKKRGFQNIYIVGWEVEPHYDEITNNLEWAIRGKDEDDIEFVNYNTRFLGRKGVMRVTLVGDTEQLESILPTYKMKLDSFAFVPGNRYAEFRKGDKVAKYGLTALIVGGGTALAVKSGLAKYLWKILVAVFVGISALFRRIVDFFKGLFRKKY